MGVSNERFAFFWPGLLLNRFFENRLSYQLDGWTLGAPVLSSNAGYRQLSCSFTKGGNTYNLFLVLSQLAATELAQAVYWTGSPGWNYIPRLTVPTIGSNPFTTYAQLQTFWQQNYVAFKQSLIDNWTTSFISAQTVHSINYGGGQGQMACATYQITCDSWVYVDLSSLSMTTNQGYPMWRTDDNPVAGIPLAPSGAGMTTFQAQQLVAATQDIAAQDFDISINHGQSIFSVKGRVAT